MYSQAELETILTAGIALICLGASVNIYWILGGWPFGKAQDAQIEAIRRAFARWVCRWERDHRIESYIKGLRGLADE